MPRLDTLTQLVEEYKAGRLDTPLMLDNDSTHVVVYSGDPADMGDDVFEMHPDDLLEQALDLLGIPHEHV